MNGVWLDSGSLLNLLTVQTRTVKTSQVIFYELALIIIKKKCCFLTISTGDYLIVVRIPSVKTKSCEANLANFVNFRPDLTQY